MLYATAFMTVLVVIFAEVLPKTIAIDAPDRVALAVARPMKVTMILLGPLVTVVEAVVRLLLHLFHVTAHHNQPICRRSNGCAARSTCFITRARSKSRTATCSAGFWTCASLRSPT